MQYYDAIRKRNSVTQEERDAATKDEEEARRYLLKRQIAEIDADFKQESDTKSVSAAPAQTLTKAVAPAAQVNKGNLAAAAPAPPQAAAPAAPAAPAAAEKKKPSLESIKGLQRTLTAQGYYYGDITGQEDEATKSAILRFQIRNNLNKTSLAADLLDHWISAPPGGGPAQPQAAAPAAPAEPAAPAAAPQGDTPPANPVEGVIAPTPRRKGGGVQVPTDAPGVADFMAEIRGIVKPEMDKLAEQREAAAEERGAERGAKVEKETQRRAALQKEQDAAAGRNPPVFLSAKQLARYNNSVKWAEAGMSPRQIAEKHAKTIYSQPGNVAADTSGLPATFLEDNNFTLTPPAQKGAMGGMSTEGQWNKLFPNRAGTPDMPNAGAKAPAEPIKPGDAVMHALIPNWALVVNEDPDRLRIRRADLLRNQQFIDSKPGWHEGNPNGIDLVGTEFSQTGDTTRALVAPEFGGSGSATNVPKVPDIWKLPSAPPAADQPVVNPDPNKEVPDLSGLKTPK